jgi:hypothetical protein
MTNITLKLKREMHTVALAPAALCAGYWAGFNAGTSNDEQDPITLASFYKGSGNT